MTYFTASIETITLRFILMMGIVIGSFFIGSFFSGFFILAVLALPVFLAALTGVSFTKQQDKEEANMNALNEDSKNRMNTAV